ncbi:MAG: hypothetical protein KAH44_08830 [Oricola sp.]|jgi:hypothetical protein|nr:hypothetical protein [Oricola sp.]
MARDMKLFRVVASSFLLLFSILSMGASAETVIQCENPKGYSYYIEGIAVPKSESGWVQDEIDPGKFAFSINDNNEADIIFIDATGNLNSARSQGATIILVGSDEDLITVFVKFSEAAFEIYTFDLARRYAVFSQHKFESFVERAGTLYADCL